MKGAIIITGAIVGVVLLGRHCMSQCVEGGLPRIIERMPENAPPKWMFRNISAIRENTDRILRLLEEKDAADTSEPGRAAA
ncbi:MAG TPA: hypothetical protein VH572_06975 [Gaiella sp.]|jgi:hypothetical protein